MGEVRLALATLLLQRRSWAQWHLSLESCNLRDQGLGQKDRFKKSLSGTGAPAYNPSTQQAEARGLLCISSHLGLRVSLCLKIKPMNSFKKISQDIEEREHFEATTVPPKLRTKISPKGDLLAVDILGDSVSGTPRPFPLSHTPWDQAFAGRLAIIAQLKTSHSALWFCAGSLACQLPSRLSARRER